MRSYPVRENPIGPAVSEILRYKQIDKQTSFYFMIGIWHFTHSYQRFLGTIIIILDPYHFQDQDPYDFQDQDPYHFQDQDQAGQVLCQVMFYNLTSGFASRGFAQRGLIKPIFRN